MLAAMIGAIPVEQWGKDHWSTFAYLECQAVDDRGIIDIRHMRCDERIHPQFAHVVTGKRYPTLLKGGRKAFKHDDWNCMEDIEAAGLIKNVGTGLNPIIRLTDKGKAVVARLRAFKAAGGTFAKFDPGTL